MSQRNLSVSSRKLDFENWKIYNSFEPRMNGTVKAPFTKFVVMDLVRPGRSKVGDLATV